MKTPKKILAIVPAKAISKRIPGKNIKDLAGKPMMAYILETVKQAKGIDRVRDAGLYSITMLVTFTEPISGISWMSIDGSYTTTMGGGLQNFVTTLPNVMLAANQILNPILAHGTGSNRTFSSRIRITRIA